MKDLLKRLVPDSIWKSLRKKRIVSNHARVAGICDPLIESYFEEGRVPSVKALQEIGTERIIWQYWAQGYENVPGVVRECLDSVDEYKGDYLVIRLDDSNVGDYIDIPESVTTRSRSYGLAQYSDLLRLAILSTYGGVWLDATVKLTGPLPDHSREDFFMYQRDPYERNQEYWENTYAYYFGWDEGFRVNLLNSVIFAKPGSQVVSTMYGILEKYWEENLAMPDYFFFQILFDVLIKGRFKEKNCEIVSDCLPHLLQQYRNDPTFSLMAEEEIYKKTSIHKLTYKSE